MNTNQQQKNIKKYNNQIEIINHKIQINNYNIFKIKEDNKNLQKQLEYFKQEKEQLLNKINQ